MGWGDGIFGWQSTIHVVLENIVFFFSFADQFCVCRPCNIFSASVVNFSSRSIHERIFQVSSDLRQTDVMYIVAQSIDISAFKIFLKCQLTYDREPIESRLVFGAFLSNRLMHWQPTIYIYGLGFNKLGSGAELFSLIN